MLKKLPVIPLIIGFAWSNTSCQGADENTGDTLTPGIHLTGNSYVRDIVDHPAFTGFGERLLPRDNNASYYNTRLSNVASLMPYHQNVNPDVIVNTLNYMIDEADSGKTIFYDFYTAAQKRNDPAKENTGIFFFRGKPNAPFAIVCPGGGWSYVGSLHEGFPLAHAISEKGYNAFVIRYRIGGERIACEDLAAAIAYIFANAEILNVSTNDYSVWGGSAGARMTARLASNGTAAYGARSLLKPATAVIAYTGHTDWTRDDPPTFTIVGDRDGIANPGVMEQRVNAMAAAGIDTEFHLYRNVGHGFALGTGTSAEGWVTDALRFWEKHIPAYGMEIIPDELETIPDEYYAPAKRQGTLVEFNYDTYESMSYVQKTRKLQKRAIVYLPYSYREDQQYNVFYLMHGGWANETTTLGTPNNPSAFKNVIDHAIAAGKFEPLIIVCPTYNNTSPQDSASFSLALTLNRNYHNELLNDLIPAVESAYATYADSVSPAGLMASRDHRGFGGFSMGSVATWRTFQYALDYFRYFLPMSCGTSLDEENIFAAAKTHDQSDYFVWVITGTEDFAYRYDENRVELMRNSPYFIETGNGQKGNFAYRVKEGYSHDGLASMEYTYNGLCWFRNKGDSM
jgi:acetyl esterase/lipase